MKQLLLTLLCVITIAGCKETATTPEPIITDAITYSNVGYLPLDTTIKYVYSYDVKYNNSSIGNSSGIDTMKTYKEYGDFRFNGDLYTTSQLNYMYSLIELGKLSQKPTLMIGTKDDNYYDIAFDFLSYYVNIHIQGKDKYKENVFAYTHKNDDDSTYIEFLDETIVQNTRYKNILVVVRVNKNKYASYQYTLKNYFGYGVGMIKKEESIPGFAQSTKELLRTYK